jgi:hypothetical protein
VPAQWSAAAAELASWTEARLVNRTDAHGSYLPLDRRKPQKNAITRHNAPTHDVLVRHFEGHDQGHLVGLHAIAPDGRCKWLALDIDAHGGPTDDPEANRRYALQILDRLEQNGLHGILLDSNGAGGFHVLVLFSRAVPAPVVYRLGRGLVEDCTAHGVREVETFPKQPELRGKGLGNWLRLPGRHHTRDHWSRVWCGNSGQWLEGGIACSALVDTPISDADQVERVAATMPEVGCGGSTTKRKPKPSRNGPTRRGSAPTPEEVERVRAALAYFDPDCSYDDWIKVGFYLTEWGNLGLQEWEAWSRGSKKKFLEGLCSEKWATFTADGAGIGSLIREARSRGWADPWKAVAARIGPTDRSTDGTDQEHTDQAGEVQDERRGDRHEVEVTDRMDLVVGASLGALATHPEIFTRAGRLVRVTVEPLTEFRLGSSLVRTVVPFPRIVELTPSTIGVCLSAVGDLFQWRVDREGEARAVSVRPPQWLVNALADLGAYCGVRTLAGGLADAPFPRPDGTIVQDPGYDELTETVLIPSGTFPAIPEAPTRADAKRAADLLLSVVRQFPWVEEADQAAWLALVLSLVARPAILGPVPAFLVTANVRGSGKSLLLTVAGLIGMGVVPPVVAYPSDPAESDKMTLSAALAGMRLVVLDNVPEGSHLGNAGLDRTVTARFLEGRELGRSRMVGRVPHHTVWTASGNNVTPRGDSARRWVPIRLCSNLERPEVRDDIEVQDLPAWVRSRRPELVVAALTILRAHTLAGYPGTGKPPLGSFESWDRVVRSAVHFATGWDPVATLDALVTEEPDRMGYAVLLQGWLGLQNGTGKRFLTGQEALRELEAKPAGYPTLHDALCEQSRDGKLPTPRQLGAILRPLKDRVVNGLRMKTLTEHGGLAAYGVVNEST